MIRKYTVFAIGHDLKYISIQVKNTLRIFLQKQAGFENVDFIPLSGLLGINLVEPPPVGHALRLWYKGPCLLQALG